MRYHETATTGGDFVTTTTTPGRLANLESDLAVPVGQALAVALSVGLAGGVGTLLLGGPIGDLAGAELWTWAGRVFGLGTVGTLASTTAIFVVQTRRALLAKVEQWTGQDLDGDQVIGEPPTVRAELHDPTTGKQQFFDLPLPPSKVKALAAAVLHNGKAFSRPALKGVLSQGQYHQVARYFVRRGLARNLPGRKLRELTPAGRAILRRALKEL